MSPKLLLSQWSHLSGFSSSKSIFIMWWTKWQFWFGGQRLRFENHMWLGTTTPCLAGALPASISMSEALDCRSRESPSQIIQLHPVQGQERGCLAPCHPQNCARQNVGEPAPSFSQKVGLASASWLRQGKGKKKKNNPFSLPPNYKNYINKTPLSLLENKASFMKKGNQ